MERLSPGRLKYTNEEEPYSGKRGKRILAFILSVVLAGGMIYMPAGTAFVEEAVQGEEILTEYAVPENTELLDNEELLEGYVEGLLSMGSVSLFSNYGQRALNEYEKAVYDQLKTRIVSIAAEGGSSEITLSPDSVLTWSRADLGITDGGASTESQQRAVSEARTAMTKIRDVLLVDCPYELYWFDKTANGFSFSYYPSQFNGNTVSVRLGQVTFIVAAAYQQDGNNVMVDATRAESAATAVLNAQTIVEKYKSASDYEKLVGYRDEICRLTSYNNTAAADQSVAYGDPWQIIYVFDDEPDTTVVCEGYAKAFQYLCYLTQFSSNIVCYTVTGTMQSGNSSEGHMWNIVTMPDGQNYLVDVTNSDTGTAGQNGGLFLSGGTGSIADGCRMRPAGTSQTLLYTYDGITTGLYGSGDDSILKLASGEFDPSTVITFTAAADQTEVTYGTSVTLSVTGDASKNVQVWNGDKQIGSNTPLTGGKASIAINTLGAGLTPAAASGDSYAKKYTLTVKYEDGTESRDVIVNALVGYQITSLGDNAFPGTGTQWGSSITASGEGEDIIVTYYLKNTGSGAIARCTSSYRIDRTAPAGLEASASNIADTSMTITVCAADNLSGIKGYSLTLGSSGAVNPVITDQGGGVFSVTGLEPRTEYVFTMSATDRAGNTASGTVNASTTGKLSIAEAVVTVEGTYVYSGAPVQVSSDDVTVTLDGELIPNEAYTITFDDDLINAGTATVIVTANSDNQDYTGSAIGSYEIERKDLTITAKNQTITYGDDISRDVATGVDAAGLVSGDALKSLTWKTSGTDATQSGTITVSEAVIENGSGTNVTENYNITYVQGSLTIEKAQTSIGFKEGYTLSRDYNGQPLSVPTEGDMNISGALYSDIQFVWYQDSVAEANRLDNAPSDAGTYILTASVPETNNTTASNAQLTVTVDTKVIPAEQIELILPADGYVYDGSAKMPEIIIWLDSEKTVQVPVSEYQTVYSDNTNAGDSAKATVTGATGSINYEIPETTLMFQIRKAEQAGLTITGMPEGTIAYGDTFTLTATGGSGGGALTWQVTSGADIARIDADGTVTITGMGNVSITVTKAADNNYNEAFANWDFSTAKSNPEVGTVSYNGGTLYTTSNPTAVQLDRTGGTTGTLTLSSDTVFAAGRGVYTWVFTPNDTVHYNTMSGVIELEIIQDTPLNINVTGSLGKTEYSYGEQIDLSGLSLMVEYESGLTLQVPVTDQNLGLVYENGSFLNVGNGMVTVSYTYGGKTVTVDIGNIQVSAKAVADPSIQLEADAYIYDGTAKEPVVIVRDGNTVIPAGEYTVIYANNVNIGTASVTITDNPGGNYEIAQKTVNFAITQGQTGVQTGQTSAPSAGGTNIGKAVPTGDQSALMIWFLLSSAAAAGICCVVRGGRKRV